jgi:hypothetical protein
MAIVALVLAAATVVLIVPALGTPTAVPFGTYGLLTLVAAFTYPIVGWLIAARRPENPIGWIFLVEGLLNAVLAFSSQYATYGLITAPGSVVLADVASWVSDWVWCPGTVLSFLLVLIFPDGRLPSRRWRPVVWLGIAAVVLQTVPNALGLWSYRGLALLATNAPDLSGSPAFAVALGVGGIASLAFAVFAVLSIIVRFRRSTGIERQQIKWFGAAGIATIALLWLTPLLNLPPPFDALAAVIVGPLLPGATAVAILRYRLYEIDRIISRTLGWAIVTGVMLVVFVGAVLVLQAVLAPLTGGSTLAVAGSTLLAAAVFQPLRRRVQSRVDRRFNRARYDAERTVSDFTNRLRHEVDLDQLTAEITMAVGRTVQPASVAIWLQE